MLYYLHHFSGYVPILNVSRYITFRTAAASITALAIGLFLGPWMIRKLREFQIGQVIRQEGPATHRTKAGTPTMGGVLILTSAMVPTLLWANLQNAFIWVAVLATLAFGGVGFADDYLKIVRRSHHGLLPALQAGLAVRDRTRRRARLARTWLDRRAAALQHAPRLSVLQDTSYLTSAWLYVVFAMLVLVFTSNAVNLTDGLDGLAISVFAVAAGAFTALSYVGGHRDFADYLQIARFSPLSGELTVFCGALVGASLGFLWWNSYPAEIFMGDVGSLGLGGALGTVAVLIKQEFLLAIVGGVFVLEAMSVIIQVASFKLTGKRVFRMAPLHHHFELIGWSEPKVITRFVIAAIIFALFSLTTLKLR